MDKSDNKRLHPPKAMALMRRRPPLAGIQPPVFRRNPSPRSTSYPDICMGCYLRRRKGEKDPRLEAGWSENARCAASNPAPDDWWMKRVTRTRLTLDREWRKRGGRVSLPPSTLEFVLVGKSIIYRSKHPLTHTVFECPFKTKIANKNHAITLLMPSKKEKKKEHCFFKVKRIRKLVTR